MQTAPVLLSILLWSAPQVALAQVNTEKLRLSPESEGLTGSLGLSFTARSGNVQYFDTGAEVGVALREPRDLYFMVASTTYAAKRTRDDRVEDFQEGEQRSLLSSASRYDNSHLAAARYNRFFTDRIIGEVFGQVEYNEFLRLDLRTLGGMGPRFVLFEEDQTSGYLGVAYMAEYERLDPEEIAQEEQADTLAHRATSYLTFALSVGEVSEISSTTYVQPRITDPSDYRILNETDFAVELSDHFAWTVSFSLRHDSDPPYLAVTEDEEVPEAEERLRPTDTTLSNELAFEF